MSKKKGDRRENQAKTILEAVGFDVETPNSTPYPQGYGVDFFGQFDFMAFRDGDKPVFGQVKSNGARGIRSFHEKCKNVQTPFEHVEVEFWVCYDNEGWRILEVSPDGYEEVFDGRDNGERALHGLAEDDELDELPHR